MSELPSSEPTPRPQIDDIAERLRRDAAVGVSGEAPKRARRGVIVGGVIAAAVIAGAIGLAARGGDDSGAADTTNAAAVSAPTGDNTTAGTDASSPPASTDAATDTSAAAAASTTESATSTTSAATESTTAATSTTAAASTTVGSTAAAVPESTSTSAAESTTTVPGSQVAASNTDLVRWAVYEDGKLFLRGRVPDGATQQDIAAKAASVIGQDNVIVEYTIDPAAPLPGQAPVFVNDTVLFGSGSANLSGQYNSLLDLGVTLLKLYPSVEIIATGYTDDQGTDEYNLRLSQRRVDAILGYVVDHGGDAARITGVAKGEADPVASNDTAQGRAANRRIEFTIIGLLDA